MRCEEGTGPTKLAEAMGRRDQRKKWKIQNYRGTEETAVSDILYKYSSVLERGQSDLL